MRRTVTWLFMLSLALSPLVLSPATAAAGTITCPAREPLQNEATNMDIPQDAVPILEAININLQVSSGYGYRDTMDVGTYHNGRSFHYGLDFPDYNGKKLYAPFAGTAKQITLADGNRTVRLTLSNGVRYWFLHLHQQIASGPINAGALIGTVGTTGQSSGDHLHLELTTTDNLGGPMSDNIPPEWWACKSGGAAAVAGTAPVASADFTDDFNRPGPAVENGWTTGGSAQLTNNQLVLNNGYVVRDTGQTSGRGSYQVPADATAQGERWVVFRWQDANNYWLFGDTSGFGYQMWKVENGNFTQLIGANGKAAASGDIAAVSWTPTEIKAYVNGVQHGPTITDATFSSATWAGLRSRVGAVFDNWGFTQNPDGTATAPVAGSDPVAGTDSPTQTGQESIWNPIGWLADELKGIFIPDADDWQEVAAALDELTDREPVGTIKDVAQFVKAQRAMVQAPTGVVVASGAVASGGYGGVAAQVLSVEVVMRQARDFSNHLAGIFAGMKLGGVNFQEIVKITIDIGMVVTFIQYLQSRVKVQA